jgi:Holliday junction resolvase RusA-like endonuclease
MMQRRFSLTVPGEPKGKGRPRFSRSSGRAYSPQSTVLYESDIKATFYKKYVAETPISGAFAIKIVAFLPIPKSASKKKHEEMKTGKILPTKKPDIDNVVKATMDALNKVAFTDDADCVDLVATKYYSESPRLEIDLYEVKS